MPQEFHVVRCFSCEAFQSQQVKKVNKFVCKLCGTKQSVRKEYGRGSGKDCRIHVQKLNNLRGEIEEKEEDILQSKLQEGGDLHIEHFDQEYNDTEQYEGDGHFVHDHQYNDFQHENGLNEDFFSGIGTSNISNQHMKEGRKSKWTSYLSNETGDDEDECTEIHENLHPEKKVEHYEGNQHAFENGWKNNKIGMNKLTKVKRYEGHPYQCPPSRISKSSYKVNSADSDKEKYIRKYDESHTKIAVNSSTQRKTNFDQNYIACPSNTVSEKKTQNLSLKENIQSNKEISISFRANTEAKVSTKKIGTCFTAENQAVYKKIPHSLDYNILLESEPQSTLSINKYTKSTFMAKVKGTEDIYNKFADAHDLEDIL